MTMAAEAGADVGIPDQAVTDGHRAQSLGQRHRTIRQELSRRSEQYLPDRARLRRFLLLLFRLDAMSDPYWFRFPQSWIDDTGPRNLVHCFATDTDDATVMPRWGKVGKQIIDEGSAGALPEYERRSPAGRRAAPPDASGDLRRRPGRSPAMAHQQRQQAASRSSSGTTPARGASVRVSVAGISGDDRLRKATIGLEEAAWRSWTTASAIC